ncbi:MAG: cell division protein SepF [Cyanobium sp.]
MSLFSRLRAVVSGDDYLDGDYDDELDYDAGEPHASSSPSTSVSSAGSALAIATDFSTAADPFAGTNVIGMPGISTSVAELCLMEPRSFDEMPRAIQALRERKAVILNLTMMEPDQAQRAGDLGAGGTFAHPCPQERVGESLLLVAPRSVTGPTAGSEETAASPTVSSRPPSPLADEQEAAPSPAWGRSDAMV